MAKILIVDDRAENREFLRTLLAYHGHLVLEAADGSEALTRAHLQVPDLVISDIVMPIIDGYEFVRQLRADSATARTPVVFFTALSLDERARRLAVDCGVEHILAKPAEPEAILRTITQVLREPPVPRSIQVLPEFDLEHRRLLTDELARKVELLEAENRQRQTAQIALEHYSQRLEALSRQLIGVQEHERRSLARELHDEIGQMLTVIKMNLKAALRQEDPTLQSRFDDTFATIESAIQRVRNLSLDLRPPVLDDFGLQAALEWYVSRQFVSAPFTIQLCCDLGTERLPFELETACFRLVQEALTNIMRHAQARHVWVAVDLTDDTLRLEVRDDGVGFDVDRARRAAAQGGSLGLLSMQERVELLAGTLEIRASFGQGAVITACLPRTQTSPSLSDNSHDGRRDHEAHQDSPCR